MPHRVLLMISSMRGGGSERQTLLLLRYLDRSRFSPHLYVTERAGDLMNSVPDDVVVHSFDDCEKRGGIYIPGRVMRQQVHHLTAVLDNNDIDVIYDRTFHMTMVAGPASLSGRRRVPRVSTIVSPPEFALPTVEKRFVGLKRRRLAKAYRQSARVVAVSRQAAKSAERYYGLPNDSVEVIHNPVDRDLLIQSAAEKVPARDERLTLVCVGRMTEEKGHRDLVSAVVRSQSTWPAGRPPLRLWMIGDGPLRGQLEAEWRQAAGQHCVEFLGAQPCPESFMAAADAVVLPSHFEGMPNVVLEAMALGRPVVATRAGGTVELEREEPTILWAEPNNPASLQQAIEQLALDPESAAARAEAAGRLIRQYHDASSTTRRIEQLLSASI